MHLSRDLFHKAFILVCLAVVLVSMPCSTTAHASIRNAASDANAFDPGKDSGPAGEWRGDSTCTIKDSPCHDEIVVYEIRRGTQPNIYTLKASKIVSGKREFMGTLDCTYESSTHVLSCKAQDNPNGTWMFQISGGKQMQGTLVLEDKRLYRRISVARTKN
jgi:hypothetical protein